MTNIKERIIGAVTIMSEKDAQKVWDLIQGIFILNNAEEVEPDEFDLMLLDEIQKNPECHEFVSQEEVMKELGL